MVHILHIKLIFNKKFNKFKYLKRLLQGLFIFGTLIFNGYIEVKMSDLKKKINIPEDLEKTSKNVKEQKKKLFGASGAARPNTKSGSKQMDAIKDFAMRRYGVGIAPSKGKFNPEKGEYRKKDAKIGTDKPDWRGESGYEISSQNSSSAVSHELGHLEQMPVGRKAHEHQTIMDQEVGQATKMGGGPTASFRHPSEVQARAAENPLRRRAGLPPHTPTADVSEGDPMRVVLGTQNEPAAVRYVDKKGKLVDQLKSGKLLSPENRQRMQDIDEGILRYDHKQGWAPSNDNNALINLRGQGRQEEAAQRLKQKYSNPNPQQDAIDLSSLSEDDHKAVQEFLAQRRGKLAASEDYDDLQKGIKLTHYSKQQGLSHLDPEYMGTGAPSEENKQGIPSVKQTSYYREGVEPESVVASGAKSRYTVEHPDESALYDIYEDPQGLVAESFKQQGRLDRDHMAQTLRDAGYHGFYTTHPHYAKQGVVNLFHKMPIAGEEKLDKAFSSKAQRRFAYANPEKFGGQKGIKEWESETPKNIPEKVEKAEDYDLLHKAPYVSPQHEDVNWPSHPKDEGEYVKTITHKETGTPVHVVHMFDSDEDQDNHTGSIYYITENGKPEGKPLSRAEVGHFNHETGSDYDPHFKAALTDPEHRGKGLNTITHLAATKDYGKIKSDYRLSPGSQKTYEKLSQHPNIKAKLAPTKQFYSEKEKATVFPQDTQHELKWQKPKKLAASKIEKSEDDLKKGLRDKLKAIFSPKPQSQGNPNDPWLGINDQKPVYRRRYAHFQGTHGKPNLPKSEGFSQNDTPKSDKELIREKLKKALSTPKAVDKIETVKQEEDELMKANTLLRDSLIAGALSIGATGYDTVKNMKPNSPQAQVQQVQPAMQQPAQAEKTPELSMKQKILKAIKMVESSGGKDTNHAMVSHGLNANTKAVGSYGLMPITIKEVVSKHPDLSQKYRDIAAADKHEIPALMEKYPKIEKEVAGALYDHLAKDLGHDPSKIGFAWLNGKTGAMRAIKSGQNIDEHWHVKKVKKAFDKISKNKGLQGK